MVPESIGRENQERFPLLPLALTKKYAHIVNMVDAITGSGLDRVLSRQDMLDDRAESIRRARSAERTRLAAVAEADAFRAGAETAAERGTASQEALAGRPRLADLLRDPETVNQVIDQTQSVDRDRRWEAAALVQAAAFDAMRQAYSSAFFDPGRAGTVLGMRETVKVPDRE